MDGKIIINCSVKKQVVQGRYGRESSCADVLLHRTWLYMCYGTETGHAYVLWHRNWLLRCVMAQAMVVQVRYGTGTGSSGV